MKKITIILVMLFVTPAWGQELAILGGVERITEENKYANVFQFEYMDTIKKGQFAYSVSYLNEGHFLYSHRDGLSLQLWGKLPLFHPSLEFKGGLGPYFYFNTNEKLAGTYFKNEHGLGAALSLGAAWYFRKPFSIQIRSNWILPENNIHTLSFLTGLAVELDGKPSNEAIAESIDISADKNEITPFAGVMISNNSDTHNVTAWGLEYRRAFGRYVNWTVTWMDEGNNDFFHRRGIASQAWIGDVFHGGLLTGSIGFGPYLAWNAYRDKLTGKDGDILAGLLSISIACRLNQTWAIRGTFNRVITNYDRDSDVFWIGPTFHFQ